MADNYLENHYEEYLKRKAEWEKKRKKKGIRELRSYQTTIHNSQFTVHNYKVMRLSHLKT